jgi:uncharacterized protein
MRGPGKNRDSDHYNREFFKGINLLDKNNISWGAIYVITKRALDRPLDIFYYLTNMKLSSGPCFNPVKIFDNDIHNLDITAEETANWLGKIYEVWYKNRDRFPNVKPFETITKNLEGKGVSVGCEDSGACAYNWAYIGPTGNTSQCGRSGDYHILDYGNIQDQTLEEVFQNKQREKLKKRTKILAEGDCKDCRYWSVCHGGCPLDSFMEYEDFNRKYPKCGEKQLLYEKYIEPLTGLKADYRYKPKVEVND